MHWKSAKKNPRNLNCNAILGQIKANGDRKKIAREQMAPEDMATEE